MSEIRIEAAGIDEVAGLRELWLVLHRHHQAVDPQTGPFVDDDSSWRVRSQSYREWLAEPDSFLLVARESGRLVGYAIVRVMPTGPEWTDTWVAADRMAEIETLVVAPELRGSGLGTRLLDAIDAELERQGIGEAIVGLVPGNEGARRLYERRGFRPRWLILARSEHTDRPD
jgi:ribosomal protein S18 acetylase RimI-like enzyme